MERAALLLQFLTTTKSGGLGISPGLWLPLTFPALQWAHVAMGSLLVQGTTFPAFGTSSAGSPPTVRTRTQHTDSRSVGAQETCMVGDAAGVYISVT